MKRSFAYDLRNQISASWYLHKRHFLLLFAFVIIGIAVGIVFICNPLLTHNKISNNLIDVNILNVIAPSTSIISIVLARLFDFLLVFAFVFLVCLTGPTSLLCFPYLIFRGFSIVINCYWIIAKFGLMGGLLLFIVYLVVLLLLTAIFLCAMVFVMRHCTSIRRHGFRTHRWRDFFRGLGVILTIVFILALAEWLFYVLFLSKVIFLV